MRWYRCADGQPCRIQTPTWDTPPGLDGPLPSALSSLPIACTKTFLISPIDSTATPGSGPRHRLPPLFNHTLPLRRPGQHLCTAKHSACSPIPPAISERLCPPFPPTTLIAALVISTRETAPKHSARPLATRRHFTTSRPPLWFSEMPPLSSAQKALVAQFVAATGANEKTAQRVRQRCLRYHVMSCVVLFHPVFLLYYPERRTLVFRNCSFSTLVTSPDLYIRLLAPGCNPVPERGTIYAPSSTTLPLFPWTLS